ncbi:thymidine phosphorylase [Rickettsiales bacterium LUAb2]
MLIPQEIIRKKRDNLKLNKEEIESFVKGITNNEVADAQISAFTMAVFFRGLETEELVNLTLAMRNSGEILKWDDLNGYVVDKHSTGGVGDLVSLILAPVVAACGVYVPMVVGRGLGHTGGTADKLEAIPGYNVEPSNDLFRKTVKELGFAIMAQSKNLAPADKRIYGVRDITATTESLHLITSSILSKKLACGLNSLVMDIKTGNGAFLTDLDKSIDLAQNIVNIGKSAGCNTAALITDMNQPLSNTAGNALEMQTVVDYLRGKCSNSRLHEINLALGAEMLLQAKAASSIEEAKNKFNAALSSGKPYELFAEMITRLGGPKDFMDNSEKYLAKAAYVKPVYAKNSGFVSKMDVKKIGMGVVALGGGRLHPSDSLDYSVGISNIVELGQEITKDTPIAVVHAKDEASFKYVENSLQEAISIVNDKKQVEIPKLIYKHIN